MTVDYRTITSPIMTDAEAWSVFAETMAGAQQVLGFDREVEDGLCVTLRRAFGYGLITREQFKRMERQLVLAFVYQSDIWGYYWKPGRWRPRVKACRYLSEQAARKAAQ